MRRSSRRAGGKPLAAEGRGEAIHDSSSGNVYRDLGFAPAEAEYLLLRSRLMLLVADLICRRGLTQVAAAELLGVSQPRVSDVVRGRVERFTIDALVEMLARAGVRVNIVPLASASST